MKNYEEVDTLIAGWKAEGLTKAEIVKRAAYACMGWPYVWGGSGQKCTPANRKSYADRSYCDPAEAVVIRKKCQVLNGQKSSCDGCKWYPNGKRTRFFDCRGFTRWLLAQVGITLKGSGATSQYKDNSNWVSKGDISEMPADSVDCVFMKKDAKMSHTGMYVSGGKIVHCSGEVKEDSTANKKWTNYGLPAGLYDDPPTPVPPEPTPIPPYDQRPTIKQGSRGDFVKLAQEELTNAGYACGKIDGIFGKNTAAATKAFQKTHKDYDGKALVQDAIIGKRTWWALDQAQPKGGE